ncbi:MAG TPA: efflux RND transporter periplasmic adaptor subunit [Myxococcota bacterium]|nr:efflux RND transporter periplasmic adaptor subunit [Myxococcota bacterium]
MNWRAACTALVTAVLPAAAPAADAPRVIAAEAKRLDFPLRVEAPGTARANESVEIRPQISEAITAIHFVEGQRVIAGAVLVELEDSEAKADVAAARATLAESETQARRAEELFKTKAVSASELDQRIARRDADRAALDAAQSRLADTKVRAPFAGRVGLRRVSLGSLVSPTTVITTLDDTDTIKLDFDVPETVVSLLEEGLAVEASSAAWPERRFRGAVATVDTRVDPVSRTLTVRALIPNPDALLRPGMFLAAVLLRENVSALMIPEQSLVPEQSRQYVWVIGAANTVEKREVQTGRRRPGQVEVISGLQPGESVVAEGTQKMLPGAKVEIDGAIDVAAQELP